MKIENQTLNEKIEERNDELSKLRAKIVANVIILSHNREKYQFIKKLNEKKEKEKKLVDKELQDAKTKLAIDSTELKKLQMQNFKQSQITGIVSDDKLSADYDLREKEIAQLETDITALKHKQG